MTDDTERELFEADAGPMGFDLTRRRSLYGEQWCEYADPDTGHRWAGWQAACALPPPEGWVLVPVEPTRRMGGCGFRAGAASSFAADRIYQAMIKAAPKALHEEQPVTDERACRHGWCKPGGVHLPDCRNNGVL